MTPEEITKLAKSLCATSNPTMDDVWLIEDIIEGILRSHCIVEKSKVREAHEVYRRKWIESKDGNKAFQNLIRMETLEQLFGSDTFDETDK